MGALKHDDLVLERWRTEPHYASLEIDDPMIQEKAPALWKDLTLASVAAALLWVTAAVLFG